MESRTKQATHKQKRGLFDVSAARGFTHTHTQLTFSSDTAEAEAADRKDTEFEKPVVVNVDALSELNVDQREQLSEIMRKSQIQRVRNAHDAEDDDEQDEDVLAAKRVMRMAAVPSQTFIGMEPNGKHKRKIKFKAKRRLKLKARENDAEVSSPPQAKKRKIYQEMDEKLRRKQRTKKLRFKNTAGAHQQAQSQTAMLSFDPDEE